MTDRSEPADAAARGRSAADRLEWEAAWEAFAEAATGGDLVAADLEQWAVAGYLLGRIDSTVEALTRAHHLYLGADDVRRAVRVGFWLMYVLIGRGDYAQAGGWIAALERLSSDLGSQSVERAYLNLHHAFLLTAVQNRHEEGLSLAATVVASARRHHDDDLATLGLSVEARGLIRLARTADGFDRLDEAMVAVLSRRLSPLVAGTVYCSAIEACEEVAELGRAREWTEALTRWCRSQPGMATFAGQCLTHRSVILRHRGDWPEAIAEAERACERFVGAADEAATGRALYQIAEIHRLRGDHAQAEAAYRQASEWGHDPQPGLALLRLSQGRTESAVGALERALLKRSDPIERISLLPALVDVMLQAGRHEDAEAAVSEMKAAAQRFGTSTLRAVAAHARASLLLAAGEAGPALVLLRRSYEHWHTLGAPYELARTRALISRACRQLGDPDSADMELGAARATFTQLGAAPDLARLGAGGSESHGLTPREMEVLRLVATGMTNQAVADELFLAVKTIDRHVANILTKLDVPTRTAATSFAYEHDLI